MNAPEPLSLRAHHLLCVLTYGGKGYSSAFVARMDRIVQALRNGSHPHVEIRGGADAICEACPHLEDPASLTSCHFQDSVLERDRTLQALMGWSERVALDEALPILRQRHAELLTKVCSGCDWLELCKNGDFTL